MRLLADKSSLFPSANQKGEEKKKKAHWKRKKDKRIA